MVYTYNRQYTHTRTLIHYIYDTHQVDESTFVQQHIYTYTHDLRLYVYTLCVDTRYV